LYYYFSLAASLGNETFWILFLPLVYWCITAHMGRSIVTIWAITYYLGQTTKDLLKLPRPPSPPVIQIEKHYSAEYGLPSTHAASATTIPFYLAFLWDRYSVSVRVAVAMFWLVSVCLSRIYMGVHSPADVICGMALGVVINFFFLPFGALVVEFFTQSPFILLTSAVVCVATYPAPAKWTNAYGDTTLILGVFFGTVSAAIDSPPLEGRLAPIFFLLRCVLGFGILFLTRLVCKFLTYATLTPLLRRHEDEVCGEAFNPGKCYRTEIPCKFVTYAAVGFNAVFTVPHLFHFLRI